MTPRHRLLRAGYWSVVAYLYLPLGLIVLMSVTAGPLVGFPIGRPTLRWYAAALADKEITHAFAYSLTLAAASACLALLAGVWTALAINSVSHPLSRLVLFCAACLPIITPGIVSAIAMRMFIRLAGLDPGFTAIAIGHAAHAAPYVVVMVCARLGAMPPGLEDAARILGATPVRAFLRITLPWLRPALAGAAVLALLESFDDFLRSFFLGGYQPTLPVLIYGRLYSGLSPEIEAISAIVLVLTIGVGLCGERVLRLVRGDR